MSKPGGSTPPAPEQEGAKKPYEKPGIIWVDQISIGAYQLCGKLPGGSPDCGAAGMNS